jgi:hypothetical protein
MCSALVSNVRAFKMCFLDKIRLRIKQLTRREVCMTSCMSSICFERLIATSMKSSPFCITGRVHTTEWNNRMVLNPKRVGQKLYNIAYLGERSRASEQPQ